MERVITVEHLSKTDGDVLAVDDASFHVERGEIFGLLGPKCAGKTTTVECLQGLRRPDAGTARVLGLDPHRDGDALRGGSDRSSRSPGCRRGCASGRRWTCSGRSRRGPRHADALLEQWGLGDRRNAAFANLSGGQQQRLLVALALVNEPELVFLDEMTTGLDPAARRVAWDLIRGIRERGTTVVLVTHFMDEAERLCDRVGVVARGTIVALDTPQGLVARHAPEVRLTFATEEPDLSWLDRVACVRSVRRWGQRVEVEGSIRSSRSSPAR